MELKNKSVIPRSKPHWLMMIQAQVDKQCEIWDLQNRSCEFEVLQYFINIAIKHLYDCRIISKSFIETELRTDEGKNIFVYQTE